MSNIMITPGSRLADISKRLSADMAGQLLTDRARQALYLEAAITYAALGGHDSEDLINASAKCGDKQNKTGWPGRWLMAGLTGTNWNGFPENDKDARNNQLQSLAGIIRASIYLAGGLPALAAMTVAGLEAKFVGPFQAAVRKALSDEAKGSKASEGFSEADLIGEDESLDQKAQQDLLETVRGLGTVGTLPNFRPSTPGKPFLLVGYWDENGCQIAKEISVSTSALSAMLPPPNLDELDEVLNGVSEHLLLTKGLLPNRPSQLPVDAQVETITDATPKRVSGRTTMLRGGELTTSLSHMSAPEMVVVTSLSDGATLPAGPYIFHAPGRAKFEADVAPENLRQHFTFDRVDKDGKLNALTFKRARSGKAAKIGLIPAGDWGSSPERNPFAHGLSDAYRDVGVRSIGDDALVRLKSEILDNKAVRHAAVVEVGLKEGKVLLKAGKSSVLEYDTMLGDGDTDDLRLSVPMKDLQAALTAACAGAAKVGISGDKRGVVCVSWTGRGATHRVYIASVLTDGTRDNADLFNRYDKTSV
jgi:hypothetical protein